MELTANIDIYKLSLSQKHYMFNKVRSLHIRAKGALKTRQNLIKIGL